MHKSDTGSALSSTGVVSDAWTTQVQYRTLADEDAASTADEGLGRKAALTQLLESPDSWIHPVLLLLILASVAITVLETEPWWDHSVLFDALDYGITILFTIELCCRIYISDSWSSYLTNCYNIVDILAVLPGYAELCLQLIQFDSAYVHQAVGSMRTLRITRVIRMVRMVRVVRLLDQYQLLEQLMLLFRVLADASSTGFSTLLMLLGVITLLAACFMYVLELPDCLGAHAAPRVTFSYFEVGLSHSAGCSETSVEFNSIPSSWWWAIVTLTTVGYGDVVPATGLGKLIGGSICVGGVMLLAIAAGQFSQHFAERWVQVQASNKIVKHFAGNELMVKEQEDLEKLFLAFQQSSDALLEKVACISVEAGSGTIPKALSPLLKSLENHAQTLTSGACSYMYEALAETMLSQSMQAPVETFGLSYEDKPESPRLPGAICATDAGPLQAELPLGSCSEQEQLTSVAHCQGGEPRLALADSSRLLGLGTQVEIPPSLRMAQRLERRLFTN